MQNLFRDNYLKEGYVIFKSIISEEKINNILKQLNIFKINNKLYYSQSEHNWRRIKNDLDEYGLLECSFENFTDLPWAYSLSRAGREILQSKEVLNALREISNYKNFCMWQNMFFDKSTGTIDHIDTWYLDTNPMGNLFGAWLALEEIDGEGGVFHVYPKSHLSNNKDWIDSSHEDFIKWSIKESNNYEKKPLYLQKGDLLLWHPSLLHGSSLQNKKGASRKSLTAHYHPVELLRSKGGENKIESTQYKKKIKKQMLSMRSYGYPISCRASKREILKFAGLGIIKHLAGDFLNKPKNLMNRKNY